LVKRFHAAQDEALALLAEVEPPEIQLPEARIDIEAPLPLFDSDDDFATATLRLIAHKALNGEGGT
jgi:hypothetical protein